MTKINYTENADLLIEKLNINKNDIEEWMLNSKEITPDTNDICDYIKVKENE